MSAFFSADCFSRELPDGWARSETANHIPYYINHQDEKTQWDHPVMTRALNALEGLNEIKFAAYRMAMKLRLIQKTTGLDQVTIDIANEAFDAHGLLSPNLTWESSVDVQEAVDVLAIAFRAAEGRQTRNRLDVVQCTDLALNWLLNTYDSGRTGLMRSMSFITGTILLCEGALHEKYHALLQRLANNGRLHRTDSQCFLQDCLQIPRQYFESGSFGGSNVQPAMQSLFEWVYQDDGDAQQDVPLVEMINWFAEEPQTIVWLPTMHRLAAAETVRHEAKCSVCKAYPIIGLRYRCLKCINFDSCQTCFFAGRLAKNHKDKHPIKEYCMASTSGEDARDFMKTVRNRLSKKKRNESRRKKSFIALAKADDTDAVNLFPRAPKPNDDIHERLHELAHRLNALENASQLPTDIDDEHDLIAKLIPRSAISTPGPDFEPSLSDSSHLQSVLQQLSQSKRENMRELSRLRAAEGDLAAVRGEADGLRQEKELFQARISRLEERNRQLEEQLARLRELISHQDTVGTRVLTSPRSPQGLPGSGQQSWASRLQSPPPEVTPVIMAQRQASAQRGLSLSTASAQRSLSLEEREVLGVKASTGSSAMHSPRPTADSLDHLASDMSAIVSSATAAIYNPDSEASPNADLLHLAVDVGEAMAHLVQVATIHVR